MADMKGEWSLAEVKDKKGNVTSKTATYTIGKKVAATVAGLNPDTTLETSDKSIDGITVNDTDLTFRLSNAVLGTSKVTLTQKNSYKYKLELGSAVKKVTMESPTLSYEVKSTKSGKTTVNDGVATVTGDLTAGYALSEDGKTITYSAAKNKQALATVKGLATTGVSASDFSTTDNVITLKKSMLGTSKVTLAGDGYSLALANDAPRPTPQSEYWAFNKTNAYYRQDTSAGFTLADDAKSAVYSGLTAKTLATVSGIKKVTSANKTAVENAITIDGKVITLGADALTNTNVKVTGDGYTLNMDSSLTNDTPVDKWTVSGTNATYDKIRYAYFKPSTDYKTFTYNKEAKLANFATVKGLFKGATVNGDGNVSDKDDNTILSIADNSLTVINNDSFGNKVEVSLANGYTLNNQLTAPAVTKTYWAVKNGTASLKQEKTDGYTLSTNAKTGAKILTYEAAKTGKTTLTLATVSGLNKTLTDTDGTFNGITYNLNDKKITVDNSVLTKSNLTLKGDFKLEIAAEGDNAVPTATKDATLWEVSGTKAVYKDVKIGYFTRKNDKAFNYNKEKVLATHATVSGLKNNASLDSFSLNGNVITLTADALPDSPNINTKITLSTKEDYTLALADGIQNVEYNDAAWSYNKGNATLKATVKTAGYSSSDDAKTITYIPTVDNKRNAITKTYATVSGVKSASGITVEDNIIKLTAAALNAKKVTLGKNDPYTLALGDDSLAPVAGSETWSKNGAKAALTVTYSPGYTPSADARTLNYSAKNTVKTLATINGINKNVDIETFKAVEDGDTKKISLTAYQLTNSAAVSGEYKFDFAEAYGYSAIKGSGASDTINVAGTGLTVTGGKGDDYIDFGNGSNTFVYATGDGDDVIANFTANDKIKITKGTPSVASEGSDAVVKVGAGSIKLSGAAGQTITILDAKNNAKTYATTAPTSDLLLDDNFIDSVQLSEIIKPSSASYTPYDFDTTLNLTKEEKFTPALTYSDKK